MDIEYLRKQYNQFTAIVNNRDVDGLKQFISGNGGWNVNEMLYVYTDALELQRTFIDKLLPLNVCIRRAWKEGVDILIQAGADVNTLECQVTEIFSTSLFDSVTIPLAIKMLNVM